jgi:hypothetical protein
MNKTILALSLALIAAPVYATNTPGADCVGVNACKTNSDNKTTNTVNQPTASVNGVTSQAQQQQGQGQNQTAQGGSVGSFSTQSATAVTTGGYTYNSKSLNINPVTVPAAAMVAPSAEISRVADPYCGPRQKVMSTDVNGRVIGLIWDRDVELGQNQWLAPDFDMPYRRVQVMPGLTQLIGHKVHETTTVLTVSTSGALAFGANGSSGAGGSIGGSRGGALQRMVTTIRVQECVAYEIVPKAQELPKVKPQPKRKPAPKAKPQCDVCSMARSVNLTVNVNK